MSVTGSIPEGEKKYELLLDRQIIVAGTTLYRIRALKDFGNVKAGEMGGFVRSEDNLTIGSTRIARRAGISLPGHNH